jgi:hypothetical protein
MLERAERVEQDAEMAASEASKYSEINPVDL